MSSNNGSSDSIRPRFPKRLSKRPSLPQLTISNHHNNTLKSFVSELQSQPTTEVSYQSIINTPVLQPTSGMANGNDAHSIFSTLSHLDTLNSQIMEFQQQQPSASASIKPPISRLPSFQTTYEPSTIRSNPTLTIYSDDDDEEAGPADSIIGRSDGFNNRLSDLISQSDSEIRSSFFETDIVKEKSLKQFFILSSAGKPIYSINSDDYEENEEKEDVLLTNSGIIQTVVNSFLLDGSKLKSIVTNQRRVTILNQSPIILVAVSKLNETELELLNQLDLLHCFLLSTLSKPHILRSFQNKEGFDLRKHLGRADLSGLDLLCKEIFNFNAGILVGALQSLKLRKTYRDRISQVLINNRNKDLLYGILVGSGGKLINILRPKNHTLHTTDLQILFSVIFNQSKNYATDEENDEELWLPICLPKFNPNGFVYSFVKFINGSNIALILISADKTAFFQMREISENILRDLYKKKLTLRITESLSSGIAMTDIPAPLIYHFIYKSRRHLQYVMPSTNIELQKLRKYYLELHSNINKDSKINVSYMKWDNENKNSITGLGWITPNYEIYLISGSIIKKNVLISSAKAIVNWCHKYEERLFVCEGAIF